MSETAAALGYGLWRRAGERLRSSAAVRWALVLLAAIVILSIIGPLLSPWSFDQLDWQHLAVPPGATASHWLGTDRLGRDLFVRTLLGVRLSLLISVLATLVSLVIGITWGALAELAGRRTDEWMMRCVDVLYSLPYLFIVSSLTTLFARGRIAGLLLAFCSDDSATT